MLRRGLIAAFVAPLVLWAALPAQAQFFGGGGRSEPQSVSQQLSAARVGDSVMVQLRQSRVRPTGVIVEQDSTRLRLRTARGGTQTFRRRIIYAVTPLDAASAGAAQPLPDPNRTRLLMAPTGRMQQPGQVTLVGREVVLPEATVGVGGRLDLSAGVSLLPNTAQFMYGGAKVGLVQREGLNVAVGAMGTATTNVITTEAGGDEYGGAVYALGTVGTPGAALTVGTGYLAAGGSFEEQAFALVGGELRLGASSAKLVSENYLLYGSGQESETLFGSPPFQGDVSGIVSLAVRLVSPRATLDLGAATSDRWWGATFPVLPLVTVSYDVGG